ASFYDLATDCERELVSFLNDSFLKLRTLASSLSLLLHLLEVKQVGKDGVDQEQLLSAHLRAKLGDVMTRVTEEINSVGETFTQQKDNPPIDVGHPPISGAIIWARSLFQKAKKPFGLVQKILESNADMTEVIGRDAV
ncbi:dynein heavy chain, partial [Kipferlia bialata]